MLVSINHAVCEPFSVPHKCCRIWPVTLAEALGRKKNDKEISVQVEKLLAEIEISCPHCQKNIQLTPKAAK